jgi:hypothetical protein
MSFDLLQDSLGDAMVSGTELESLFGDAGVFRTLRAGYLPIINASDWDAALRLAEEPDANIRLGWWTVMLPLNNRLGVTVPQDSGPDELIALFTGPQSNPQILAYDPVARRLAELPVAHCSAPSWGICAPGSCGGCKASRVWDPVTKSKGIRCRCPDEDSGGG